MIKIKMFIYFFVLIVKHYSFASAIPPVVTANVASFSGRSGLQHKKSIVNTWKYVIYTCYLDYQAITLMLFGFQGCLFSTMVSEVFFFKAFMVSEVFSFKAFSCDHEIGASKKKPCTCGTQGMSLAIWSQ